MKKGNKTDQSTTSSTLKNQNITVILAAVGVVAVISVVFFLCMLQSYQSSQTTPTIFDAAQIGATNDSLLLSWSCTHSAEKYTVHCADGSDSFADITTDIPFARIGNLEPNSRYSVEISATVDGRETEPIRLSCATDYFCTVNEVRTEKIAADSAEIAWDYSGNDSGFVAIAYVLDQNGKRHLTSQKVEIPAGAENRCTLDGLIPEMHYTVVVMPTTRYFSIGRSDFTTASYYETYKNLNIVRFVICPEDSDDSPQVRALKFIKPDSRYKTSLIINGKAASTDKVNITLFIKNADGNLISETNFRDIPTNPEDKPSYVHRVILMDFVSPPAEGDYLMDMLIDGQFAARQKFTVEN